MTSLRPWLKPTLLGPLLTTWGLGTLGAILVGAAALSGGRLDGWLQLMIFATFFGCAIGVILVGVDVVLLKLQWRALPTGGRAWLSSLLTPIFVFVLWNLGFFQPETMFGVVLWLFGPMFLAAVGSRLVFSARPA